MTEKYHNGSLVQLRQNHTNKIYCSNSYHTFSAATVHPVTQPSLHVVYRN